MAVENFFTLNLRRLRDTWRRIAGNGGVAQAAATGLTRRELAELRVQFEECVAQPGGEVSARARAAKLGETYLGLGDAGRRELLELMATFGPDPRVLEAAARTYLDAGGDGGLREGEQALRDAVRSPRSKILTQFTALPEGVKFLVDLRADLLRFAPGRPPLELLERELAGLLALWFDVGFLELQRITWDSPASLLERLIAYEAVHEIRSWEDLRNRLDSDRRCYAFFHPRMPREPLIFVEVALARGLAGNLQALLDENSPASGPRDADAAIFYSISATQAGLRGISFGNFLIKRVVNEIGAEFNKLKTFATLSPIPGFRRWLGSEAADRAALPPAAQAKLRKAGLDARSPRALAKPLSSGAWHTDAALAAAMREPLLNACARYLATEKEGMRPLDPVARFHLENGARVERLNWLADTSTKGLSQSLGMMVNYLYDPADMERNHEAYRLQGRIALSAELRRTLKG